MAIAKTIAMLRKTEVILATKSTKLRSLTPALIGGKTLMDGGGLLDRIYRIYRMTKIILLILKNPVILSTSQVLK